MRQSSAVWRAVLSVPAAAAVLSANPPSLHPRVESVSRECEAACPPLRMRMARAALTHLQRARRTVRYLARAALRRSWREARGRARTRT